MTLPRSGTRVTYPDGAVSSHSTVLHIEPRADDLQAVLLAETACHPVDSGWPDQGADRAVMIFGSSAEPELILDCVVAATNGSALFVGAEIPVRKGTEGWTFVVAHILPGSAHIVEGSTVEVSIDATYRHAQSAGHSACHLASLALNAALRQAWSKEVPLDGYANPDFDRLAIATSTIDEFGSRDVYRIGKSLRRKGFSVSALDDLSSLADDIDRYLAAWCASGAAIRVVREGGMELSDLRYWQCDLPGKSVRIPCGGTHIRSVSELERITVALECRPADGGTELVMTTAAAPASPVR